MPNYTEHFNLDKALASDNVNPLVIDNARVDKIDAALYAIQNAAVTTATHSKTTSTHTLTRSVTTAAVFRFVATADFVTGDTFNVDGSAITAKLPSGIAIPDGAFKSGYSVVAIHAGGFLTLLLSQPTDNTLAQTALDAAEAAQADATTALTNAGTAQTTANAALPKAGGTMTGAQIMGTTSAQDVPIKFLKNSSGDYYAMQAVEDKLIITNRLANGTLNHTVLEVDSNGKFILRGDATAGIQFGTTGKVALNGASVVGILADNGLQVVNYAGSAFKSITAYSFIQNTSARKYKERITPMAEAEAKLLLDMEAVEFYRKAEPDKRCTGFIADDVEKIQPKYVFYKDNENGVPEIESLDYIAMIPDLIKLVQMQQKQIDELNAKLC